MMESVFQELEKFRTRVLKENDFIVNEIDEAIAVLTGSLKNEYAVELHQKSVKELPNKQPSETQKNTDVDMGGMSMNSKKDVSVAPASQKAHGITMGAVALDQVNKHQKSIYNSMNRYGKALDKSFKTYQQPNSFLQRLDNKSPIINQMLFRHFVQEGHFDLAERLQKIMKIPSDPKFLETFRELHQIRMEMKQHNLENAIQWAFLHSNILQRSGRNLVFKLCVHDFIFKFYQDRKSAQFDFMGAIQYIRNRIAPFGEQCLDEIERFMMVLVYHDDLQDSPYNDFWLNPDAWDEIEDLFCREYCNCVGYSFLSPLKIVLDAGAIALPTLMKMSSIIKEKKTEWTSEGELPVEIILPQKFQFHSVFTCPVSREQATEANCAMMLPCSHVIAKDSLKRLIKAYSQKLKCPYCPCECAGSSARPVYF